MSENYITSSEISTYKEEFLDFIFNLTYKWDLKTCFQKDIPASLKYSFSNIWDRNFLKQFIEIKRDFFKNIELKDLLWKWDNHFCMTVNLLQENIQKKS
jgi:hypothetical protein